MILLGLVIIGGCDSNIELGEIQVEYPKNYSPSLFLWDAKDGDSDIHQFINYTEYEIIRNEKYLGKFESSRLNTSFLNLSIGDTLDIIVRGEKDNCDYMLSRSITYQVPYTNVDYITPTLKCGRNVSFELFNDMYYPILNGDNITVRNDDRLYLEMKVKDVGRYRHFTCDYDKNYVKGFVLNSRYKGELEEYFDRGRVLYNNDIYYLNDENVYEIEFLFDYSRYQSFNTTLTCHFIDWDYYISDDASEVKSDMIDDNWYSVGKPNVKFEINVVVK